jgi:P-type Ca2+ transporter type 2C
MKQAETSESLAQLGGLTSQEVEASRRDHGSNVLTPPEGEPWWKQYLSKFDDPVIRILMVAAVIAIAAGAAHGEYLEGIGILVAILLATALAFINEFKASQEFEILNKTDDDTPVRAKRGGVFVTVPKRDLVVGDLIQLEAGEAVPADAEVLSQVSLLVDQASLTGETDPVAKYPVGSASSSEAGEHTFAADSVYRGTTVVDGHALCRVTAVGDRTRIGGVARSSAEETGEVTPLNEQLEGLSKVIGVVGFLVASLAFAALVVRGYVVGEIVVSTAQMVFGLCAVTSVMVALCKVWLPWVFDGLELIKAKVSPPAFLEREGVAPWLQSLGAGVLLLGSSYGLLLLSGWSWAEMAPPSDAGAKVLGAFMIAVTIIVVAVPEGLAMSVTLSLAYSMRRMTKANTLVRRMHACETIGSATVICSDKTGTLTTSRMVLREFQSGALTRGLVSGDSESLIVAESIAANSTADLTPTPDGFEALGNPTESALLLWIENARIGRGYLDFRSAFKVESQLTFSTERKFMSTFGRSSVLGGREVLYVKGAPEIVLARCIAVKSQGGSVALDAEARRSIESKLAEFQARGMRTLGLAMREGGLPSADLVAQSDGLCWLGFAVIEDPVRPEVPTAIQSCVGAGIEVKIITGDNTPTAREIGRQIGLSIEGPESVLTGAEFAAMDDARASQAVAPMRILARAQPQHKQRVVQLLQKRGEVVAVTGDGVNDGPALNYADVGLAMGKTGTSVARSASDMVVLDDSFASIASGVMWGRSLYRNIQRFIVFQLTINVAALIIALLGPFIGVAIPLNVIQMLWVNLIMDTFAALALATEPADPSVMRDKPRGRSEFIISGPMARSIFGWGMLFVAVLVGLLLWMKSRSEGGVVSTRDLTLFYSIFVMLQFWNIFNARRFGSDRSAFAGLVENRLFVIIALAIAAGQVLIVQFGGEVFRTEPLGFVDWLVVFGCTAPVMLIGEAGRMLRRRAHK